VAKEVWPPRIGGGRERYTVVRCRQGSLRRHGEGTLSPTSEQKPLSENFSGKTSIIAEILRRGLMQIVALQKDL
jgi:hypothetical protein